MSFDENFPQLLCCTKLEGGRNIGINNLFDIKFYPWLDNSGDQYFAIAGTNQLIICQTAYAEDPPFKVLHWVDAPDKDNVNINSVAWTKDQDGKPLLCTAGASPRHISVFDLQSLTTIQTLSGHGRGINDLAVSPTEPDLLASASEDFSIRLWNLRPEYKAQPCIAILAGDGHNQAVLACSFHASGRWLLSGGMDSTVALWKIPELRDAPSQQDEEPKIIFYPHFYSAEVHDNIVDCIKFFDNVIISRCSKEQGVKRNEILIWSIDGFDGWAESAPDAPVSAIDKYSRSAFEHEALSLGFRRLMTLDMSHSDRFYLRFGLYHAPGHRPMLCMGNQLSRLCFWDLQQLEEELLQQAQEDDEFLREAEALRSASVETEGKKPNGNTGPNKGRSKSPKKAVRHDPFKAIDPHHTILAQADFISETSPYTSSAATWSPDGKWLISVGDQGLMVIMHRDDEPEEEKSACAEQ